MRFTVLALVFWSLAVALRLVWLQWLGAGKYKRQGTRQFLTTVELPGERGLIYDRNGALLSGNAPGLNLYQCDDEVSDPRGVLMSLNISPRAMGNKKALLLARGLDPDMASAIADMDGVFVRVGFVRKCPLRDAALALVGRVGYDGKGLWGVEYYLDRFLAGTPGYEVVMRTADRVRMALPGGKKVPPEPGWDVYLTVDADLQDFCYQAIKDCVVSTEAKKGFVIVMDPGTGEILAMTQYPGGQRLYALTDPYEPGSTFKPFVMAAALEGEDISLQDTVPIPPGKLRVGKHLIGDVEAFPQGLTWRDAIVHSSNRSMAFLAMKLGPARVYEMARRFGFFSKTDISLPGEWSKRPPKPSRWRRIRTANAGMGQGIMVTGIQMAMAYGAIANGGLLLAPRLLKRMVKGNDVREFPEKIVVRRVISQEVADSLRALMVGVVEKGTGKKAMIQGLSVAGKTGTAQKVDPATGAYSQSLVVASFAGFFPAYSPRYLIYVVVDEPQKAHYGGDVAAPCFRRIALFLLNRDMMEVAMR